MKTQRWLWISAVVFLLTACVWAPISYDGKTAAKVEDAVAAFQSQEALGPFFQKALAYAVFPSSVRAGTGFGGAFGMGWLFEGKDVTGKVSMAEVFAGANLGAQSYRSILFFRTEQALKEFKRGRFEFTGQANAAHFIGGYAATPSFNKDVAMFVQVRGGLLLEASVGTQRYDFFPLVVSSPGTAK